MNTTKNIELPIMKKVVDMIYYEGPFLSLYEDEIGRYFFYKWCNSDEVSNTWLVFEVSGEKMIAFYKKEMSLRDLVTTLWSLPVYLLHIGKEFLISSTEILGKEIPVEFLPQKDSFFDENQYESDAIQFLQNLSNESSVVTKLTKFFIAISFDGDDINSQLEVKLCKKNEELETLEIAFQLYEKGYTKMYKDIFFDDKIRFALYKHSQNEFLFHSTVSSKGLQKIEVQFDDLLGSIQNQLSAFINSFQESSFAVRYQKINRTNIVSAFKFISKVVSGEETIRKGSTHFLERGNQQSLFLFGED